MPTSTMPSTTPPRADMLNSMPVVELLKKKWSRGARLRPLLSHSPVFHFSACPCRSCECGRRRLSRSLFLSCVPLGFAQARAGTTCSPCCFTCPACSSSPSSARTAGRRAPSQNVCPPQLSPQLKASFFHKIHVNRRERRTLPTRSRSLASLPSSRISWWPFTTSTGGAPVPAVGAGGRFWES